MKRRVSLVVTDLDNTLYDWVEIWYSAFNAMLEELVARSGLPRPRLEAEIQTIFQKHGTTEYAFVIEEIPSLREKHPGEDLTVIYREAISAYRAARRSALRLYPGVLDTLGNLKRIGCRVVAFTESMEFYAMNRVKKLGLDGLIDSVYSPADHIKPPHLSRFYDEDQYRFQRTVQRCTPPGDTKPNPDILVSIINCDTDRDAREHTIYIGDSLMKDIKMAQAAGVTDVHAKYGVAAHTEAYEVLRRVTHWTDEDVEREKAILDSGDVCPTFVLERSFEEILDLFDFVPHPVV